MVAWYMMSDTMKQSVQILPALPVSRYLCQANVASIVLVSYFEGFNLVKKHITNYFILRSMAPYCIYIVLYRA